MKFGVFDHVDRSGLALADQFDKRLEYVAALEDAGFFCYHVAEHHATPLNMVPVPGVWLGAVARATATMRFGPLCYLLPLYSPLRLIEEIAMLDHLSRGRFDLGVGRGVSPFELNFHKVDPGNSQAIFLEALDAVVHGLTHDELNHEGAYFSYSGVPMELRPLQEPHPPIWYPTSNPASAAAVGKAGYNFVTLGAMDAARDCIDAFVDNFSRPFGPALDFPGGTAIGISRHVVVGDTDEDAIGIARPAYRTWHASLTKLYRNHGVAGPTFARGTLDTVEGAIEAGTDIVGSADTVRAEIERQIEALGVNYMICQFYFGDMDHADAMRSVELFRTGVMPRIA